MRKHARPADHLLVHGGHLVQLDSHVLGSQAVIALLLHPAGIRPLLVKLLIGLCQRSLHLLELLLVLGYQYFKLPGVDIMINRAEVRPSGSVVLHGGKLVACELPQQIQSCMGRNRLIAVGPRAVQARCVQLSLLLFSSFRTTT